MKYRTMLLPLITAILVCGAGSSASAGRGRNPEAFHVAKSPAEKSLDGILRLAGGIDDNLIHYVLGTPFYKAEKDTGYSRLFTKGFLRATAQAQSDRVKESCDGQYPESDGICGLDYNPVLCSRDTGESGHLYRTLEDGADATIIAVDWPGYSMPPVKPAYRLVRDDNGWRLDGVLCGDGGRFNMECSAAVCADAGEVRRNAEAGDADAQFELGVMYELGRGVRRDAVEAAEWMRKAAVQGHARAQYHLGYSYAVGSGVTEDKRAALQWFRKAAGQGQADALYELGDIYEAGRGVIRDDKAAMKWYRKSAGQGHAGAQYRLALLYDEGRGIGQNRARAAKWYRKSADLGHGRAQNRLGQMYELGEGVGQDYVRAAKLYRKAAENGVRDAQYRLGLLYKTGKGVARDLDAAELWLRRASGIWKHEEAAREVENLQQR